MEDPNQKKKSRFDLQPHYIEWGLTALGVIVACVLVVFVLFRMTIIWGMIKKFFGILSPFIYGFVMAYLLMPVFNMLYRNLQPPMSRKFKNGTRLAKGLCSALTLAFGLAVVGVLLLDGAAAAGYEYHLAGGFDGPVYERDIRLGGVAAAQQPGN